MSLSSVLSLSHCVLFLLSIPKDMVILPYKDSLLLFSRYLQQLVMESLGKEYDLDGNRVCVAHLANLSLMICILCTSFWRIARFSFNRFTVALYQETVEWSFMNYSF
jgi:hypothetical protein